MPPKKNYNKKRSQTAKKKNSKNKTGLNKIERKQVNKMIKGKRETFYLSTVQYCAGTTLESTFEKNALTPHDCFQSGNRITMVGLTTAESLTSIGQDVNSNVVHTHPDRLFITGGVRARDLGGVAGANLDGDMGYMKSHLQRIKIHTRGLFTAPSNPNWLLPLNFRVLVVQVNGSKPAGDVPTFTNVGSTGSPSLFRDREDMKVGIDDQITVYEFHKNLRVDTQAFKVVRDINFKLSNPIIAMPNSGAGGAYAEAGISLTTYQYPSSKEIDLWLPQPKKPVKFDEGTQLPTNYDYRYYTFVFCSPDGLYDNKVQGTTEDRWFLESTSIARVQEY